MERKELMLECPECGELISALVLYELCKCDNCGCSVRCFEIFPPCPNEECMKTCQRKNCTLPEYEILVGKNMGEEIITWKCPCGHTNNAVELYDKGRDWPWYVECSICGWKKNV